MATVLGPSEKEMPDAPAAIDEARATLIRLGARPLLERLDAGHPAIGQSPRRVAPDAAEQPTSAQTG